MVIKDQTARRGGGRNARRLSRRSLASEAAMIKGTPLGTAFAPLSEPDVIATHRAALRLLEEVGMAAPTPRVAEAAAEFGCRVDGGGRLRLPSALVEDCVARAAKSFQVHARDSAFDFEAKNGQVNFATGGAAVTMLDRQSRTYRASTLRDLFDLA